MVHGRMVLFPMQHIFFSLAPKILILKNKTISPTDHLTFNLEKHAKNILLVILSENMPG